MDLSSHGQLTDATITALSRWSAYNHPEKCSRNEYNRPSSVSEPGDYQRKHRVSRQKPVARTGCALRNFLSTPQTAGHSTTAARYSTTSEDLSPVRAATFIRFNNCSSTTKLSSSQPVEINHSYEAYSPFYNSDHRRAGTAFSCETQPHHQAKWSPHVPEEDRHAPTPTTGSICLPPTTCQV